jgi:hypothetical protein
MKLILTFLIIIIKTVSFCQSINGVYPLENLSANKILNNLDLDEIDVIVLGEHEHGNKKIINLYQDLIRIINKNHGFDILIIESDFLSLYESSNNNNANLKPQENIHKGWIEDESFQSLLEHIETNKMEIYGFDSRLHGAYSKNELEKYLFNNWPLSLFSESEKTKYFNLTNRLLKLEFKDTSSINELDSYIKLNKKWLTSLNDNSKLKRSLNSIINYTQQIKIEKSSEYEYVELREMNMIENINQLLNTTLSGKKVIIWGHNVHVQPGATQLSKHASKNIGDFIKKRDNINSLSINTCSFNHINNPLKKKLNKMNFGLINLNKLDDYTEFFKWSKNINPNEFGDYLILMK